MWFMLELTPSGVVVQRGCHAMFVGWNAWVCKTGCLVSSMEPGLALYF
jgi:hypothetical protein